MSARVIYNIKRFYWDMTGTTYPRAGDRTPNYEFCKPILHSKHGANDWFNEVLGYLMIRYHPIETRTLETLRYVELHSRNRRAFSYEFGSIIRDIGSTFGSTMDKIVRNTVSDPREISNIRDYRNFLVNEVKGIELIGAELNSPFKNRIIVPFENIKNAKTRLSWWDAYNNLKHSEIENYQDGCLNNVIHGIASLAILYTLMSPARRAEGRLFSLIGYFSPIELVKAFLFGK